MNIGVNDSVRSFNDVFFLIVNTLTIKTGRDTKNNRGEREREREKERKRIFSAKS